MGRDRMFEKMKGPVEERVSLFWPSPLGPNPAVSFLIDSCEEEKGQRQIYTKALTLHSQ